MYSNAKAKEAEKTFSHFIDDSEAQKGDCRVAVVVAHFAFVRSHPSTISRPTRRISLLQP